MPGLRAAETWVLMQGGQRLSPVDSPAVKLLEGRHVAVVASAEQLRAANVFAQAAQALGARVAHITPADLGLADTDSAADAARLLGRLYAAVGCAGLDRPSQELLMLHCGVPVLHDLAGPTHASRLLADVMTLKQAWAAAPASPVAAHPVAPLRLGLHGAPRSALLRAWRRWAAEVGVELLDLSASDAAARRAGCDFVCRPGPPAELLALSWNRSSGPRHGGPEETSLLERQLSNHVVVVQALLQQALGSRR